MTSDPQILTVLLRASFVSTGVPNARAAPVAVYKRVGRALIPHLWPTVAHLPSTMPLPTKSSTAPRQRLTLTTTSLRNVIVSNKSDVIYYEVVTPKWQRDLTTISRLDPNTRQFDVIGEMKNDHHGKAEEVRLYGGALTPAHRFLEDGLESDTTGMK